MSEEENIQEDYPEAEGGMEKAESDEHISETNPDPTPSSLNPQSLKEMEVHHHTHASHGKKTWKDYFWEFLMLFLAVFCGFLAENFREHGVERHREKEYVISLIKDFEYDTLQFNQTIKKINRKIPFYDSVLLFFKNSAAFSNKLPFRFYIKTNLEVIYTPSEPTLQQLKGSGNLRLLENKLVLDSILIYDSKMNGAFINQNSYVVEFNKRLIESQEKVFDDSNFNLILNDVFNNSKENSDSDYDLLLFTKDKEKLMELSNLYINTLESRKKDAKRLIELIKKEYQLKDE
jgi:hypothetical protein